MSFRLRASVPPEDPGPDFEVVGASEPEKSAGKSAGGTPFTQGADPRRGRGPVPGAPNAGRPPSAVREAFRLAAADRLGVLATIADAEEQDPADRIRAIDVMAKYGLGQLREVSVEDVRDRLRETLGILRQELDESTASYLIGRLAEVWQR